MKISSIGSMPGETLAESLGLVIGTCVVSQNLSKDFMASIKSLRGGEIEEYTQIIDKARKKALERMMVEAKGIGADGVVGVTFTTSAIMSGTAEVMAYGTAVTFCPSTAPCGIGGE